VPEACGANRLGESALDRWRGEARERVDVVEDLLVEDGR
jgi:hypothetical protein